MDCIVGIKNGQRYYLNQEHNFTINKKRALVFEEHKRAIETWISLTNYGQQLPQGMERLFVPVYNKED